MLLKTFIVLLLLVVNIYALPAKMQVDRYMLQAQKSMQEQNYHKAKGYFEKILGLGLKVPNNFNYLYAKTLLQTKDYSKALNYADLFLTKGGDKTKHYVEALDIYTKAEEGKEIREKQKKVAEKPKFHKDIGNLAWQDQYYTEKEVDAYKKGYKHGKTQNWSGAKSYCRNLSLDGKSDWMLPTKLQLKFLYNNKSNLKNNMPNYFWSSSEADRSAAWLIDFYDGYTGDAYKSGIYFVRCVRIRH